MGVCVAYGKGAELVGDNMANGVTHMCQFRLCVTFTGTFAVSFSLPLFSVQSPSWGRLRNERLKNYAECQQEIKTSALPGLPAGKWWQSSRSKDESLKARSKLKEPTGEKQT